MKKQEFMKELRESLYHEVSDQEYTNSIQYYSDYIDEAIASGQAEEEIIEQLGNPRLLAKTIIDVKGNQTRDNADDFVYQEGREFKEEDPSQKVRRQWYHKDIPIKWYEKLGMILVGVVFVLIVLGILGVAFSILWNIVLPIVVIVVIFKLISNFFRR